jgi:predicted P-loop ATPase
MADEPIGDAPVSVPEMPPHLSEAPPLPEQPGPEAAGEPITIALGSGPGYGSTVSLIRSSACRDLVFGGKSLEYNEMAGRPELGRARIADHVVNAARESIERVAKYRNSKGKWIGYQVKVDDLWAAFDQVAREHSYHPVRTYLTDLVWDKVGRIDAFADLVLGVSNPSDIQKRLVRMWFIGAAARGLRQGCKLETAFILQGAQGAGKTRLFEALAGPDWYLGFSGDFESRDGLQQISEKWLVEFSELESLRGREITKFKAFMSLTEDTWVGKWQRAPTHVPRSFSIVGTTNDCHFLEDPTGNRRFWIIGPTGRIRVDVAEAQRDQLWAEAKTLVERGATWWLDDPDAKALRNLQVDFERQDSWEDRVLSWADETTDPVTIAGVLEHALDKKPGLWTSHDEKRVAAIFRKANFYNGRRHIGNRFLRVWIPCSDTT